MRSLEDSVMVSLTINITQTISHLNKIRNQVIQKKTKLGTVTATILTELVSIKILEPSWLVCSIGNHTSLIFWSISRGGDFINCNTGHIVGTGDWGTCWS